MRDQSIGVLASGPNSTHQALLYRQLSDDVVYFGHTMPPDDKEAEQLVVRGIGIVAGEVASLEVVDDRLTGVRLSDGSVVERQALVVSTRMIARAGYLSDLGLTPTEHPSGLGEHINVDPSGQTDVPGFGRQATSRILAQVGGTAATGALAAIRMNVDLVAEEPAERLASDTAHKPNYTAVS